MTDYLLGEGGDSRIFNGVNVENWLVIYCTIKENIEKNSYIILDDTVRGGEYKF